MKESNDMENINPDMLKMILSHLQKATSQPDEEKLAAWLEENPENLARFQEIKRIWEWSKPADDSFSPDTDRAWAKVKNRMNHLEPTKTQKAGKVISISSVYWKIAASVLLVLGIGYLLKPQFGSEESWTTVSTQQEKQLFFLPDSSRVWLNRHSTLSYNGFEGKTREVKLEGEAFFQVKRRPQQAFRITGNQSLTEVLGTSFNLKSQTGKADEVEVVSGLVAFSSLKKPASVEKLSAGQKGEILKNEEVKRVQNPDPNFLAWQTGKLDFNNLEMEKVVQSLENFYGIRIQIEDPAIRRCRFTGSFQNGDLAEVLHVLSVSVNLQIDKKDSVYSLRGSGCP